MHTENIERLKQETIRLVRFSLEELKSLKNDSSIDLIRDQESKEASSQTRISLFNKKELDKAIEQLQGEEHKLDKNEMVVAVVGTMKAGKSTTINAIIGSEVLPNRNRPMTAIPTLIRHTPKQATPVIKLENNKPLIKLMAELKKALSKVQEDTLSRLNQDKDMAELIEFIQDDSKSLEASYEGENHIFWILKTLNDLVRLSKDLDIDFPFEDYDEIHELPVIEIEFTHLRGQDSKGTFTLLDTPGPNEAGQSTALKAMLDDQLKKASAVLLVMNYSQPNSEADAGVRKSINAIAKHAKGRLFVLVNKFDQKDKSSDGAKTTKEYVANNLMEGMEVKEDQVFPVSARWGYLANQAKNCLEQKGELPNAQESPWIEDFGSSAFGGFWEEDILNSSRVRKAIEKLWEKSLFEEPLEKVIVASQKNIKQTAIQSAVTKLDEHIDRLNTGLKTTNFGLTGETEKIRKEIQRLQQDIEAIETLEAESLDKFTTLKDSFGEAIKSSNENAREETTKTMEQFFTKKLVEVSEQDEAEKRKNGNTKKKAKRKHKEPLDKNDNESKKVYEQMGKRKILFKNEEERNSFLNKFQKIIQDILKTSEDTIIEETEDLLNNFQEEFSNKITKNAEKIINNVDKRMDDLDLDIRMPQAKRSDLKLQITAEELVGNAKSEETRKIKIMQDGLWAKVKRKFDLSDAGWGFYTTETTDYLLNLDEVKKRTLETSGARFIELKKNIGKQLIKPTEESSQEFFEKLTGKVEDIRSGFSIGLKKNQADQKTKEAIINAINRYLKVIKEQRLDIKRLCTDAKKQGITIMDTEEGAKN